jgi:hypothetical protein
MTEILFILAVVFIGYVYLGTSKNQPLAASPAESLAEKPLVSVKNAKASVVVQPAKAPAKKPIAAASPKPKAVNNPKPKSAPVIKTTDKKGLKDPKTGEVVSAYSNYRFTKRWIKDALVFEGFLDKVYKNDELNADIEANIKSALVKLEALKKYQV